MNSQDYFWPSSALQYGIAQLKLYCIHMQAAQSSHSQMALFLTFE